MSAYYLDSSALVKRYIAEKGSDRVVALVESRARLLVSRLSMVEVSATIARRTKAGDIATDHATSVVRALDREFAKRFEILELDGHVMARAIDVVRTYALRGADGVQLACALIGKSRAGPGQDVRVVSADLELNQAAAAEQFDVVDPNEDTVTE